MKKFIITIVIVLLAALVANISLSRGAQRCVITRSAVIRAEPLPIANMVEAIQASPDTPVTLPVFASVPGWHKVTSYAFVDGWVPSNICRTARR